LAKYVVGNLFGDYARVEVGVDLLPDTFYADVLLIPNEPMPEIPGAGLLTRLTMDARCLIEPFSGKIHPNRLEANLAKLRLALYRAYKDQIGAEKPKDVLWIISTYFPKSAIERDFAKEGQLLEPGLLKWEGFCRETVYLVNTNELILRDETLMFFLFAKEEKRKKAVIKIFGENLEPYVTLLNLFDERFRQMAETKELANIDIEELQNLIALRDTREEALRELGRQEARKEICEELAKKMKEIGEPPEKISSLTGLSLEEIQNLQ
jgi:hypothetical protein